MRNRILQQISSDFKSLIQGLVVSAILLLVVGVWRIFDTNTFLFLQIVLSCICLYLFLLFTPLDSPVNKILGNKFLSVLVAFTLVSTLLLNIDRSRSVFLVKWVSQSSKEIPANVDMLLSIYTSSLNTESSIKQRIEEQKDTLFIKDVGSGIEVTRLGKTFIMMADLISKIFNLKGYQKA